MATQISASTKTVGFWSAVLATAFSITDDARYRTYFPGVSLINP